MKKAILNHLKNTVLTALIASIILPGLVHAVNYTMGVKTGDWIKYGQISVNWTGNGTTPSYIIEEQKTDWAKLEVQNVIDTTVMFNATTRFNNDTQNSQTVSLDLNSSEMGSRFLISANLTSGDPISTQPHSPTINQTTTRTYASASRNVNLLNITTTYQNQNTTLTIYFDQATGIAVEIYMKGPDFSNPNATVETTIKATETNMWTPDLFGTLTNNIIYIIAGTITIATIIIVAITLRKKKPPTPQQPPPPPPTTQT